ncbi:quinone-dependent dihydroorotate dehydrogenase [Paenibacillus chartarius]|uniref:Dihydroorotate dehydrogenase (quinone) n=1 Tax=Paenibacillus chartarius TaxID=747481 RepID=A0ABV6DM92_9BACL
MIYKTIAKPVLFRMDPEAAHHLIVDGLGGFAGLPGAGALLQAVWGTEAKRELRTKLWNLEFHTPIGLAAGLDKNGRAVKGFSRLGFGFVEVGTVTPVEQAGNEQPRLFRLPPDEALINRMGFNNVGTAAMADNLRRAGRQPVPVAVNIGKNKTTPNEQAEDDYRKCIQSLYPYGDFFVVNISSPNTPDLRNLQHGNDLERLLRAVTDEMAAQRRHHGGEAKPILVKIAPDLSDIELEATAATIRSSGVSGIIATNTTLGRDGLLHPNRQQAGGLSGRPLTKRSTEIVKRIYSLTEGKLPIVGCGGIFTAQDAYDKIRAGASLIEVYTALIYEGPALLRKLNDGLAELLKRDGFAHIAEAVGADHR